MRRFWDFIKLLTKDVILFICLILDLVGVATEIFTKIDIPSWILVLILLGGIVQSSFKIYKASSPDIHLNFSLLKERAFKKDHIGETYMDPVVTYNLYIVNQGINQGVVEDIKLNLLSINGIKENFLLDRIGVNVKKFIIADKEIFPIFGMIRPDEPTRFPIMVDANKRENKYLVIYLSFCANTRTKYLELLEWLNYLEFEIILESLDNYNKKVSQRYTFILNKDDIDKYRKITEEQEMSLAEYFNDSK